jgi:uncharacterized protein (DUF1501 family)
MAVRGFGSPLLASRLSKSADNDRVLVIVQMFGGNDGLNTVIPLDQYSALSGVRGNILIPEAQVLPLSGTNGATGLHTKLSGLLQLWDDGRLGIVQGVGYPFQDYSHFRSTDIWETGGDGQQVLDSGWTARYLNNEFPNYPEGFPNIDMPDPLAIRVGSPISMGLQYSGISLGVSIKNTTDPYDLSSGLFDDAATADCKGDKLSYIRSIQRQTDQYGDVIQAAALQGCNQSTLYPTGFGPAAELGQALKIVAQLICGGLRTRIYWVSLNGFDTHSQQCDADEPTQGVHAVLMNAIGSSIRAFQDDVEQLGIADRVLGITFSEFGRRVKSSANRGTDHGAAAPLFLFGTQVIPGMLGTNPVIEPGTSVETNLPMQYDFRSVYAGILTDWFCLPPDEVDLVLLDTYQPLSLVDPEGCMTIGLHEQNQGSGERFFEVAPNPFVEHTAIRYVSAGGRVLLQIYSAGGQLMRTLLNQEMPPGEHSFVADLAELPAGPYYCRFQNDGHQQVRSLLKVR